MLCPFSNLYIVTFTVLIGERTWYGLNSTFTTISYHHHFYDYYTNVNFTFSYIFSVIPCAGADPKNDFNNSNMDCWDHPWCVENISRHLTRSLLLPFPCTSLQGPACHLLTCAPHSLPPGAQRRAETVEFGHFVCTQQYQCNESFSRDTWTSV